MEQEVLRYDRMDPASEARVDDLLGRMTPVEKVGQLVQVTPFLMPDPDDLMEHMKRAEEAGQPAAFTLQLRPGLEDQIRAGSVGSIFGSPDVRLVNRCQRLAVEESRLGIPLIVGNDVIHGFRTIFPIPLAESCTWDPVLLERAARAAAEEASASGTNWIFAPMVDVARDPRWGRIAEGAGEDPVLGMAMARARVRGFQASDLTSGRLEDNLVVTAVIQNTGERAGDEVVQLYVRDLVGSVTRPVKELKDFQRITLQPGEEQTVRFEVPVRDLGFMGLDMRYTVEPGAFKVWVGPGSTEGLEGEFEVRC